MEKLSDFNSLELNEAVYCHDVLILMAKSGKLWGKSSKFAISINLTQYTLI
jgi:hypothetical protein